MQLSSPAATLTKVDINKFEIENNLKLPADFVSFFILNNGGIPSKRQYVWADSSSKRINCFGALRYDSDGFTIDQTYYDLFFLEKYLPEGILPFAVDDGGNFFCISCRNKDFDHIYYLNNDHYDPNNEDLTINLIDSTGFKHFIENLQ